ncbi:MAG: hypothetical protein EBU90_03605 [Proteobacteria bacterium]|nr:hypothetical protein [Pseudomonadota bacterium]NBP13689.1 hypothetical protein [bacterium]
MISKNKFITSAKAIKQHSQQNIKSLVSVILLCDSPGYRMKSYGPASLISLHNKKLIDFQIEAIQKIFPLHEIIVCVGFDAEKICKYIRQKYRTINIRIVENQIFSTSNSSESARIALNNTNNDKILICDGSLHFTSEVLAQIPQHTSSILTQNKNDNLEVGVNINEHNNIEHFSFGASMSWSEMCFLHNYDYIESLRKILLSYDKNKFMFEALNDLINTKHNLVNIANKYEIYKINNLKIYNKLKESL